MKKQMMSLAVSLMLACAHLVGAQYRLEEAFPGLSFDQPVGLEHAGDGSGRLFVVEQAGRIQLVRKSGSSFAKALFLDISTRVASGGEMGLLGLAFHPDFARNGYFYVDYTRDNPRESIISRFRISSDPDAGDPLSEKILLTVAQPYSNHNGGRIAFGPDGCLYIGLGDGGSGGDPQNHAQDTGSLLGKILRIDVDATQGSLAYAIPADNPFAGNTSGAREEIYAWGLRNPWRFSFDRAGRLWCADVGQNSWEEIDLIRKGGNYGWRIMEGTHCYNPASGCNNDGLELPLYEYGHNSQGGYSITGGFVYTGARMPELRGRYIFGDYVSQQVWAMT
ncbi:MAG TPA: PQQ-dependent sugar dehydrogenase, partial [bacterium]|nr:PQQ-dependent sugar dehydrogenase [bacterium]